MTSIESAEMIIGAANIAVSSTRNFLFEVSVVSMMRILGYNYGVRYLRSTNIMIISPDVPVTGLKFRSLPCVAMSALWLLGKYKVQKINENVKVLSNKKIFLSLRPPLCSVGIANFFII